MTTITTPQIAPPQRQRRIGLRLTLLGIVLTVLGMASIGVLLALTLEAGAAFDEAMDGTYTHTRLFGLYQSERSLGGLIGAVPALIFLLAMGMLMLGEMLRRGNWTSADRGFWQGGSHTMTMRVLSPRVHLAWIAAPVLAWAALVAMPTWLASATGWPTTLQPSIEQDVWILLGTHGALASGVAGVIAVSLVKKLAFARRVAAGTTLAPGTGSRFWRAVTYFWRFDLWLAFIGGALIGPGWIALYFEDLPFLLVPLAIGVLILGLGMVTACNFWRSAENLAAAESVS